VCHAAEEERRVLPRPLTFQIPIVYGKNGRCKIMIKKILVPIDGSDHAKKAVQYASDLALKYDAGVHLVHVVHEPKIPEELLEYVREENINESPSYVYLQRIGEKIMGSAEKEVKDKGIRDVHTVVIEGDPANAILEYARKAGIDMIVMGSRGLGKVESIVLGSVSNKVCHMAECTCVTVK
jgi:nucleotide-binding universal stress UspA family protein